MQIIKCASYAYIVSYVSGYYIIFNCIRNEWDRLPFKQSNIFELPQYIYIHSAIKAAEVRQITFCHNFDIAFRTCGALFQMHYIVRNQTTNVTEVYKSETQDLISSNFYVEWLWRCAHMFIENVYAGQSRKSICDIGKNGDTYICGVL